MEIFFIYRKGKFGAYLSEELTATNPNIQPNACQMNGNCPMPGWSKYRAKAQGFENAVEAQKVIDRLPEFTRTQAEVVPSTMSP